MDKFVEELKNLPFPKLNREVIQREWEKSIGFYKIPDTRSNWKKIRDWIHWRTIGRFKNWLHRDCGDY